MEEEERPITQLGEPREPGWKEGIEKISKEKIGFFSTTNPEEEN